MNGIELIQSMQVLSLREGDTLVLKVDQHLSSEQMEYLRGLLKPHTDQYKCKTMILEKGMDIGVLRPETANEGKGG